MAPFDLLSFVSIPFNYALNQVSMVGYTCIPIWIDLLDTHASAKLGACVQLFICPHDSKTSYIVT